MKRHFTYYLLPSAVLVLLIACTGSDNPVGSAQPNPSSTGPAQWPGIEIFPNPTDTVTTVKIGLPEACFVRWYIQNPVGRLLYTFVEDTLGAGYHTRQWDLSSDAGKQLRNGLYFVTLEVPDLDYRQSRVLEIH